MVSPLSERASGASTLTAKNRVWDFFENSNRTRPANRRNPQQLRRKNRPCTYKTASGIPVWPSRDPIEEVLGIQEYELEEGPNLYSFAKNDSVNRWDFVGLVSSLPSGVAAAAASGMSAAEISAMFGVSLRVATAAVRQAAAAAARQKAKKIATCLAIHAAYKAEEKNCRGCIPQSTPAFASKNCACWSAVVAGRALYLAKKCDYILPGSIARGSAIAEAGHKKALASASAASITCCACAFAKENT